MSALATLAASYTFADGDTVSASVDIATGYPDALSEGVKTCLDLLRGAMVSGMCAQEPDEDDSASG